MINNMTSKKVSKQMKTRNITKVLLLLAITILLVGLVSAATTNKTSTAKNTKVVKDTTKTSVETATKSIKEPAKKVTDNTITKKEITKKPLNQTRKTAATKTYTVSNFKTLHSALTSDNYKKVNINIKSNIKLTSNTELSDSIKTLNINGNGKTINGNKKYQFLDIPSGSTVNIKNLKITNCKAKDGGAIYNKGNLTITQSTLNNNQAEDYGGAIYNKGKLIISDSKFNNNKVKYYGGAICDEGNNSKIEKNIFKFNTAKEGSAIYVPREIYYTPTGEKIWVEGHYLVENGIYVYRYGSPVYIEGHYENDYEEIIHGYNKINNNTFQENIADSESSTIIDEGRETVIENNIYDSNFPSTIYIDEYSTQNSITNNKFNDKAETVLTIKLNTTKLYSGSNVKATITLKDDENNIIKNQKVKIKFGTKTYTVKTNSKGIATKTYKTTKTGNIKVTANYAETTNYYKSSANTKMKVLPKIKTKLTLTLSKTKAKVKDKIKITATLKNKSNKAIKNEKVAIKIGSKSYTKKTNKKGTITLTYKVVKSALGKAIKATYNGNYMYLKSKASKKLLKA